MTTAVADSTDEPLATIADLESAIASGWPIIRKRVFPPTGARQPNPLIRGTERFADEWLVGWHAQTHEWPERDVATYSVENTIISGEGQVWMGGCLVSSREIMPPYVAALLEVDKGGNERLRRFQGLPIRTIHEPCLVALGHGAKIYGHFLIEMLFRILVTRQAYSPDERKYRVLLRADTPAWLLRILSENFGIQASDIAFMRNEEERVLLRNALIPSLLLRDGRFLPAANELIEEFVEGLGLPVGRDKAARIFVTRGDFHNPAAPYRVCLNEQRLIEIAVKDYGFTPVALEELDWRSQVSLFRSSAIVLGLAGSGLHNSIFSNENSRLASIGALNLVQSQIGALRGQRNAFLTKGLKLTGKFHVDEDMFNEFIGYVCKSS